MRITDLLDRRSVSLTAAPKTKSETLDMVLARELPFLMVNVMQLRSRGLRQWSSKMV